jgi:hypothetical protein
MRCAPLCAIFCVLFSLLLLGGCATVRTQVVELKPAQRYAPTEHVEILLEKPERPYTEIALLESRGEIGASEADLLEQARREARALGADAIVRLEVTREYQPPVTLYEPWLDPFYYYPRYHRFHHYRPFGPFGPFPPFATRPYRVVGGGYIYRLKALAIRYGMKAPSTAQEPQAAVGRLPHQPARPRSST